MPDRHRRGGGQHRRRGDRRPGQVRAHDEDDLRLAPGLDVPGHDRAARRGRARPRRPGGRGPARAPRPGPASRGRSRRASSRPAGRPRAAAAAAPRRPKPDRSQPSSADSEPIGARSARALASRAAISADRQQRSYSRSLLDDADGDRPEPVELGAEHVPGSHRHGRVQGPGHDQLPGSSPPPISPSVLASQATTATGSPRAAAPAPVSTSSPLPGEHHPDQPRIQARPADQPARDGHRAVGCQIGDRVGQPDPPVGEPQSTISTAAAIPAIARRASSTLTPGPAQRRAQHEGDLGLDLRLDEIAQRDRVAVGVDGRGQHRAVIGRVDPDHLLHRLGREPDLEPTIRSPSASSMLVSCCATA